MATPAQIRQAADDKLATIWAAIQSRQDTYAASHGGRFWQGKRTHTGIPADGIEATPDIGTACPTDQLGAPWPAAIRTASLPFSLEVSPYDGPLGVGYEATVTVRINGNTWARTAQSGPEVYRVRPWHQVVESP